MKLREPSKPEARVKLNKALQGATSFKYTYDFGDDWVHKVRVEKVFNIDLGFASPMCIDGVRPCPPEDVGGQQGYLDFVEAILDPSHAEYEATLEGHGGPFEPNEFETGLASLRLSHSSRLL